MPNERYWSAKLLHDHFAPGDTLVRTSARTSIATPSIHAQGFVTAHDERKLLLINRRRDPVSMHVPGLGSGARVAVVDTTTDRRPADPKPLESNTILLGPHATAVVAF